MAKKTIVNAVEPKSKELVENPGLPLELLDVAEAPWEKFPDECQESHGLLMELINHVPKKTILGLYKYLASVDQTKFSFNELVAFAEKYHWVERAWAYERHLAREVQIRQENALKRIQTEYEAFAESLIAKHKELLEVNSPEELSKFLGLLTAGKTGLPAQISQVYKSLVGDKAKIEFEGKFDHRVIAAVMEYADKG